MLKSDKKPDAIRFFNGTSVHTLPPPEQFLRTGGYALEASVIKWKRPLWSSYLDGFGNHTPGIGRFEQSPSDWDVVHPGRSWAVKCKGKTPSRASLLKEIENFLTRVGQTSSGAMDPSGGTDFV